ncbi:MAG: hypothetical protein ACMUIE_00735, partial [Thermoplasmatota archaeon]
MNDKEVMNILATLRSRLCISVICILVSTGFFSLLVLPDNPLSISTDVSASFAGGSGTLSDPYQISNVTQLQNMSSDLNAHYILINNINASDTINWNGGLGFDPIGNNPSY